MERHYTLEYWIDDGWYVGRLREIPGIHSQGADLHELEENIQDAYRMVAADRENITPATEIFQKELSVQV